MLGMTMFSALTMQWAQQELATQQDRNARADQQQARELAAALEFSILTEDTASYDDTYTLERAEHFAGTAGRTRGGNTVQVTARTDDTEQQTLGRGNTQVALTASDNMFTRNAAGQAESAAAMQARGEGQGTVLANIGGARGRQVLTSLKRMEAMAEQLYAFYAGAMKFPDLAQYTTLDGRLKLYDAWGESFDYAPEADGQMAVLSFTTPWGHTQTMRLNLKE